MNLPSLGPRGEGWLIGQLLLIAAVVLAPMGAPQADIPPPANWTGIALIFGGLLLATVSVVALGPSMTVFPRPAPRGGLVERGPYRVVRNPVYLGLDLLAIGSALAKWSLVTLIVAVVLAVFLDLKARREEALLAAKFPDYAAYRARTARFIPGIY
jgi:protein-S-isoprenylcysteine O-methyltransferase Ste14